MVATQIPNIKPISGVEKTLNAIKKEPIPAKPLIIPLIFSFFNFLVFAFVYEQPREIKEITNKKGFAVNAALVSNVEDKSANFFFSLSSHENIKAKTPKVVTKNSARLIVITSDESDETLNAFDVRTGFPDLYDR